MSDQTDRNPNGPSAAGIIDCLKMLAREAAELDLEATQSAIQEAMAACRVEAATAGLPSRRTYH